MHHSEIESFLKVSGKVLMGLDLGLHKVGVALGYLEMKVATPLVVCSYRNMDDLSCSIKKLIVEYSVSSIVVGMPSESKRSAVVDFISALDIDLPFFMVDERGTTKEANAVLASAGVKRKARNAIDDKVAAKIILETFFDILL